MFNNLIESSSHFREYKRRGSFLLFTTAVYAVLFSVTGVVAIYAYDARLEKQSLEFVILLPPQEIVPEHKAATVQPPGRPRSTTEEDRGVAQREVAMLDVDRPEVVPKKISLGPNKNLPLPPSGPIRWGEDKNPSSGGGGAGGGNAPIGGGRQMVQPVRVPMPDIQPPPPAPQQPKIVSRGVISGDAISLPKPVYPEIAKRMRIEGAVRVQVLVDLDGRVVSATVLNGSPYLRAAAQKAAMQARFTPTLLNDQPVRVSGVIIYNFQLN